MKNWETIWNARQQEVKNYSLEELLRLNGYDQPQSRLTPKTIYKFCENIENSCLMMPGDSIYEVGCGSGATLHYFKVRGYAVGGCDLSKSLIEVVKANFEGDFSQCNANEISCSGRWDHVISFGTFLYFPDLEYAGDTLIRMLIKAKNTVSVFDIPDLEKKDICEARRRELIGPEYDDKYKDLQHLYIHKDWWKEVANSLGIDCRVYDQEISGYENSAFRYNVTFSL